MNMMCNIKPAGKMLAFSDHWRHGDLNLDQFLVFMVTLRDRINISLVTPLQNIFTKHPLCYRERDETTHTHF